MKYGWMCMALTLAMGLVGCQTRQEVAAPQREIPLAQAYDLALVKLRAQDLRPGMTRADAYALLGAPADYGNGAWVYRGEGGEQLTVRFDGDRYASHKEGRSQGRDQRR